MGAAVSLQYFPVDFRKLGLFQPTEKASTPNKPIVATRLATQGQLPVVVQPPPSNPPVSTAPHYLAAAQPQPTAMAEIDQAEVLIADDGKVGRISQERSPDTQADRLQGSKQSEVAGMLCPKTIRQLDKEIDKAIKKAPDAMSLKELLDAHPHAGSDPADKSVGTFILECFRKVASWFNSAAFAWQGKQAVALLNKAARAGNAEAIQILLDRGMDLAKDKPIAEPALQIAVASGNAEATRLLLGEVLRVDPGYCRNAELTGKAASEGHANVLEILVEQGMDLPEENFWPRFSIAIEDFLRWKAAVKQPAGGQKTLSRITQKDIKDKLDGLKPQFGWQLNGMRCSLNEAQKRWRLAAMYAGPGLPEVEEHAYTKAGFTAGTAKRLVEELNSNAKHHIFNREKSASVTLAQVLADEFTNITSTGKIRPDLLKHLMDQGMYGLVADMVVDAATSATASQSWNAPDANRKVLFAIALDRSAGDWIDTVHQARDASGDPDLFDQLLSPQLELLVAYYKSRHDQEPVPSIRKKRAGI